MCDKGPIALRFPITGERYHHLLVPNHSLVGRTNDQDLPSFIHWIELLPLLRPSVRQLSMEHSWNHCKSYMVSSTSAYTVPVESHNKATVYLVQPLMQQRKQMDKPD
jgi:hypothetical protein